MSLEQNFGTEHVQEAKNFTNPELQELYNRIHRVLDRRRNTQQKEKKANKDFDNEIEDIQKDLGKLVSKNASIALTEEFQAITKMFEDYKRG